MGQLIRPSLSGAVGLDAPVGQTDDAFKFSASIGAIADGAFPAGQYVWDWSHADQHLFDAIQHETGQAVHSIADMHSAIEGWKSVSQWTGPSLARVHAVKGHLAEFVARDHLIDGGHSVAMPEHANNPGWDLSVDGHHLNVKDWADAGGLSSHFDQYPDVGVILPHDAAHIPEGALHFDPTQGIDFDAAGGHAGVFVDDALCHADTGSVAEHGLDAASGHVHAHVPWITIAVSSYREGTLLLQGHTDLVRAAKNVAVDGIAIGGGGFLGAKAGAAIGTFIAPGIGTAIGALIGGIGGAIAGRKVASDTRLAPLNEAKTTYETRARDLHELQVRLLSEASTAWLEFETAQQRLLSDEVERISVAARNGVRAAQTELRAARRLPAEESRLLLSAAEDHLERAVTERRAAYQKEPLWRRWVWPSATAAEAWAQWRAFRDAVRVWKTKRRELDLVPPDSVTADAVLDLALVAPAVTGPATAFAQHLAELRLRLLSQAEAIARGAVASCLQARVVAIAGLHQKRDEIVSHMNELLEPEVQSLKDSQVFLVSELRKAGIEVPK